MVAQVPLTPRPAAPVASPGRPHPVGSLPVEPVSARVLPALGLVIVSGVQADGVMVSSLLCPLPIPPLLYLPM